MNNEQRRREVQIGKDYQERALAEAKAGGSCEIDYDLPTVTIQTSAGEEYFLFGEDAEAELNAIPEWLDVSDENYFLAVSQNW